VYECVYECVCMSVCMSVCGRRGGFQIVGLG